MKNISVAVELAVNCHRSGQFQLAGEMYKKILQSDPHQPDALYYLGVLAHDVGNDEVAIEFIRRAIQLRGDSADASYNLGVAYGSLQRSYESIECFRRAILMNPDFAEAHFNLGNELRRLGELTLATSCYQRTLELKPEFVDAYVNLGLAYFGQGNHEQAIVAFSQALSLKPDDAAAHSNILMSLHHCEGITLETIAEAHSEFERMHAASLTDSVDRAHHQSYGRTKLRLGFVSADFGLHPVGYFTIRLFENIDRDSFETVCYSDRFRHDSMTRRFQLHATEWRDVVLMNDEELAKKIRGDQIDILFDLAGHTASNRLLMFARKPAPIQVTWAGYVGTTGLKAMDYILADRFHVTSNDVSNYREQILHMPHGYVCYAPPDDSPVVSSLPALHDHSVTFGCFNNPSKINSHAIQVWAAILSQVPGSRLVFKYRGWNDRTMAKTVTDSFANHKIESNRLEFHGQSPHHDLLKEYNRIDIALDTFPYSGGLTTCESLWMGVPVVTCPGQTFASRHSLSHLTNVGMTETIARSWDDYVSIATSLAVDLPRLTKARANLRQQMATSPLCDGQQFASDFGQLLRTNWKTLSSAAGH